MALNLDSDTFRTASITGKNSTASELQISPVARVRAIYSAGLSACIYIHGIMSAWRTHEVQPSIIATHQRRQHAVFTGYTRQILYIFTDFQVSERLHGGPEFSGNYLIDYTIGYITIT